MKKFLTTMSVIACLTALGLVYASQRAAAQTQKRCYAANARVGAKLYRTPDAEYDPVLGYSRSTGPRRGSPAVDDNGFAQPIKCVAAPKSKEVKGTLPKFYCTQPGNVDEDGKQVVYKVKPHFKGQSRDKRDGEVYGEFLASRFSKAMGFFADDEWVADVTCPDCEKSLTKPFQGAKFDPFQPAAGIEMGIGEGLEIDCRTDTDFAELGDTLSRLDEVGSATEKDDVHAQVDAFKLWLAFIDHGDTKKQNHKFACLKHHDENGGRVCDEPIFYVSDMGSTFGFSSASEKKATLDLWRKKEPIRVENGGKCYANAKSVGDTEISDAGRQLLASDLQRLLDREASDHTITRVFEASRNAERDQPAAAWTAEFIRKAKSIISARCK
ncbi:MAG TPA: hypothetical protein VL501_03190 [Pyrinomonadaceae bacterium]|nr:hypothetical protein [Pyrinomonadaceae bacterium]